MLESSYTEAYTIYSTLKGGDFLKVLPHIARLPSDIFHLFRFLSRVYNNAVSPGPCQYWALLIEK